METKANRVRSTTLVKDMVNSFYDDLRQAKDNGHPVCWVIGPGTYTPLLAMGIRYLHLENYATLCSGRKGEQEMLDAAEEAGYSRDVCSYLRIGNGASILGRSGAPVARPDLLMPPPDFLYCVPICPTMTHWYECLLDFYKCPGFYLDIPAPFDECEVEDNIIYVTRQLRDFVCFLEDMTHKKFDWNRFRYLLGLVKEGSQQKRVCLDLCRNVPSPMSLFDWFISLAPANTLRGREQSVKYWKVLRAELEERVATGVGAVPTEKFRLYWDHIAIWYKLRDFSEWFAAHDACIVAGNYVHFAFYPNPDDINLEKPLESLARERCEINGFVMTNLDQRIRMVGKLIEDYKIDGIVAHAARTCRPLALGQHDLVAAIADKYGVPGIVLNGDHTDPALFSEKEWHSNLESFFEVLCRKKSR